MQTLASNYEEYGPKYYKNKSIEKKIFRKCKNS